MARHVVVPVVVAAALAWCGCTGPPSGETGAPDAAVGSGPELEPGDPSLLRRPFTAEQIRDEWVPGLTLVLERASPAGSQRERWTVVSADADGADIEYAALDAGGNVVGEPRVERSRWTELRDHASFPVGRAVRGEASRDTPLGTLDGWVYVVDDPDSGAVTELFFARELPGAPVHVLTRRGDDRVSEMTQVERHRPE